MAWPGWASSRETEAPAWFPQALPVGLCWGFAPAVGFFPLDPIEMFVEGRNVLGEHGQGSELPLHPQPKPRPPPMLNEPTALRGDQRQQIPPRAPWKQNSSVGASQNPFPGVTQGDVWDGVTPGTPRARGEQSRAGWDSNSAGWVGWVWGGAGQGPSPPFPSCPGAPTAPSQPSYGIIHFEVWLLLTGLIEELVITSP